MRSSAKALILLVATAALIGAGYRWGATATTNAYEAGQLKDAREANRKLLAEVNRGELASGALQTDLRDLGTDYQQLDGAFRDYKSKHPLLARSRSADRSVPGAVPGPPEANGCAVVVDRGDAGADLSRGAVWMWNSALLGKDSPVGACGLADQSESACTPATGISLDEAWSNHSINAKLCAEDRVRHQHLIDFIKGRRQ